MGLKLKKVEETFTFFDNQGNQIDRVTEIRFDPLTNESSRLVFDPGMKLVPPNYQKEAVETGGENCPFCKENLLRLTPVLPKEISEEGRVCKGEATLFPNLFPYSKHNGVVIFSPKHYVKLEEFTPNMIKDAFWVAKTYIEQVFENDSAVNYVSINWNYLPQSGGSILHPHMHTLISETATNFQAQFAEALQAYQENFKEDFLKTLYETEKANGERWIGERGNVAWMHAYAPKSHNDFIGIFPKVTSIFDLTEEDWLDFTTSLTAIFATLSDQGLASFNMVMTFSPKQERYPVYVRLIPRLTIGQLGTSDMNFFQTLHQEPLSYKKPEDIARIARVHFSKINK